MNVRIYESTAGENQSSMARFSVGGDDDGNEEGSNNNRPLPKRPRTAAPIVYTLKRSNGSSSNSGDRAAAASNSENPASRSAVPTEELQPEEPAPIEEISEESEEESDESFSDSSEGESVDEDEEEDEEAEEEGDQQNLRDGDEVQPAAARSNSVPNGNGAVREETGNGGDAHAPVSVTLTDPDVLDCPICLEPLSSPVYQCENGHIACASCCNKMRNKCANCCWPIGYNRCRAIEKVLESVRVSCRNVHHGCTASLNYSKKLEHEKTCIYTPCSCPYQGCTFIDSAKSLYVHFALDHPRCATLFRFNYNFRVTLSNNQKHIFVQDRHDQTLFVLNRSIESFGNSISVVCIAPVSSSRKFVYELTCRDRVSSIQLKTVAEATPQWVSGQAPGKRYIVIPKDFMTLGGELHLELTILRPVNRQ